MDNSKVFYIFKGDDTDFNYANSIRIKVISDTDLSRFSGKFKLGSYQQITNLTDGEMRIDLSHEYTRQFPYGNMTGTFQLIDKLGRIKTVVNTLKFYVTNDVSLIGERNAINFEGPDYNILVEINLPLTSYNDLQDLPTYPDGDPIKGTFDIDKAGVPGSAAFEQLEAKVDDHIADKQNPHEVTKSQVGLGNVDNTSDADKPISTAVQTALNAKQDNLTQTQLDAVNSGIDSTKVGQITTNSQNISTNADNISGINSKIPAQASSENQLADKNFVNSSIATNTANFIGTFENVTALKAYSGTVTNNDYAFVVNSVVTDNGNDWATYAALNAYDKSKLTEFDYAWIVNGSKFDLYRFDIVNQSWVSRATAIDKDSVTLNTAYNRYKATVSSSTITWSYEYTLNNSSFTADQWAAINSGITSGAVTQIGTNAANITSLQNSKQDVITDLGTIRSGASAGATALQPNTAITAGTATKVTYDSKGLVTGGSSLDAGDIPDLSATYISNSQKGAANGVATLDANGEITSGQINFATDSRVGGIKQTFDATTGTWTVTTDNI